MAKPLQTLALLGSLRALLFLFNVVFWVSSKCPQSILAKTPPLGFGPKDLGPAPPEAQSNMIILHYRAQKSVEIVYPDAEALFFRTALTSPSIKNRSIVC